MAGFDINQIDNNHKGMVVAGALAFIASFFPFYGKDVAFVSWHASAWDSWGILPCLLLIVALAASVLVATGAVQLPKLPLGWNLAIAAVALLALVLFILHALIGSKYGVSLDAKWGSFVLMILVAAQVVFAYLASKTAGEKLEWDMPQTGGGAAGAGTPPSPPSV